jgi:uncharacterized protein (DUF362 family)
MSPKSGCQVCDLEFTESMWGYVAKGAPGFNEGYKEGKARGNRFEYEVTIHVEDFEEFKKRRTAKLTGWVTCRNLFGEKLAIANGQFGLYTEDPESHEKRFSYEFDYTMQEGITYHFSGYKRIVDDPGFDILEDHTTLFARIDRILGEQPQSYARGIIHYHLVNLPSMVSSFRCPKNDAWANRVRMARKFLVFVTQEVGKEYFRDVHPTYRATYTNVVCRGRATSDGQTDEFFFFSGKHPKGFPWGDKVGFDDVGLIFRDGDAWRRFAFSDDSHSELCVELTEGGQQGEYHFHGPLFEVAKGYQISYKEMHLDPPPEHLHKANARIDLRFKQRRIDVKNIPFKMNWDERKALLKELTKLNLHKVWKGIKEWFDQVKDAPRLGYTTDIYRLYEIQGEFQLDGVHHHVDQAQTLGEGERGTLILFKKPPIYYNYFCAIEPVANSFRVHVRSGILRTLSKNLFSAWLEERLGAVVGQVARMDYHVQGDQGTDIDSECFADALAVPGEDLLEINNDHYRQRIFQRRIVKLPATCGVGEAVALEEDMSVIDLESIHSDKVAHVAVVKAPDRFKALDRVLQETDFFAVLDTQLRNSGKAIEEFSIVIKPNFSFMYSLTDISTFTDPKLVDHLIDRIYERGYRNITVVEAQSTYSEFFTNRDVPTLARYLGYNDNDQKYKVVDLSEGYVVYHSPAADKNRDVHPLWRDADFRISFAKNKTHAYAFYSLAIKNIYGALPRKNKFKEYHCNREEFGEDPIYTPTIDFIQDFPVHFGLIDAYFSADGAFGVFADKDPNFTSTILGGDNLVALDWVAASKMGLAPMISKYMELAVGRFGKPSITLVGDSSLYSGWRNVPEIVTKVAHHIDRDYASGRKFYAIFSTMDPFFVFKLEDDTLRGLRVATAPVRKFFFEWVSGERKELAWKDFVRMTTGAPKDEVKDLLDLIKPQEKP